MPSNGEIIERNINDFQKIQSHMMIARKENATETYESLKNDYLSLKAVLTSLGVNLTDIDKIKEQGGERISPVSKAAQRATEKYAKENYDRIFVKFPKGTKEKIQAAGETVNGFINRAVLEKLEKQAEK